MAPSPRGTGCAEIPALAELPIAEALVPEAKACGRRTSGPCACARSCCTG